MKCATSSESRMNSASLWPTSFSCGSAVMRSPAGFMKRIRDSRSFTKIKSSVWSVIERSSASLTRTASSIRLRAVMSRLTPTTPTTVPVPSRSGTFVVSSVRAEPSGYALTSSTFSTGSPAMTFRSSSRKVAAMAGGKKSASVLPSSSSDFVAPRERAHSSLATRKRLAVSFT